MGKKEITTVEIKCRVPYCPKSTATANAYSDCKGIYWDKQWSVLPFCGKQMEEEIKGYSGPTKACLEVDLTNVFWRRIKIISAISRYIK